jgi:hypothetical protein
MRHSKTRNRSGQVQDGEQQTDRDATADIARQPQVAKRLDAVDRAQVREHSLAVLTPLYWLVDVTDVPLEEEMTTANGTRRRPGQLQIRARHGECCGRFDDHVDQSRRRAAQRGGG